jgi:hypothetical protein
MRIETFTQNNHRDHRLAEVVIETRSRWLRLVVVYGTPPGSHIGFWRTRMGDHEGLNLRIGKRFRTCLTLMAHTHPARNL